MNRWYLLALLLLLAVPASAAEGIPGDADADGTLARAEYASAALAYLDAAYMNGAGDLDRDDIRDAAWVYARWDGKPREVTDSTGRTVTLYRPLRRVVTFSGESLETLRSLGFDMDKVVAVDKYSYEKETFFPGYQEKANVGSIWSPDMEKVLILRPDTIILYATISTAACDDIQKRLEASSPGIRVLRFDCFKPTTYAGEIRTVASIIDEAERGEEFASFYGSTMDRIRDGTADIPDDEKTRVYFEYWFDYTTVAASAGYNEKTELAGGKNPFATGTTEYPVVDPEAIIVADPEVVVKLAGQGLAVGGYAGHDPEALDAIRSALLDRPGWSRISAVKDDRVHVIHSDILGGAQHFIGTAYLAKWFYPDRFSDLDPHAIHQRYLTGFQGIDFDLASQGTFVYP
ncbi:ABC transporter substrate-binding protein [Methanoculleus sp. YWC-01]|uniref:ABC transporter substrate-binding protein n=1 Tax=Methanoculleus nereidis TaxID=2735141 RepID=A0ABU3Z1M4_9EURY|nr:ABC transporter substrate-binding protein [Methanoculleus sp. YWC-01]MDV4342710.1 ABC transporter substrate-binding protein [Methanoculleus sp. YWC-01]